MSCSCSYVSTGQLYGELLPDRAFPWPHSEPSTPTLVLDQLVVLDLLAPLPTGRAFNAADQLWIAADHLSICGSLHCRLVSHIHAEQRVGSP